MQKATGTDLNAVTGYYQQNSNNLLKKKYTQLL